ncbi:unnamed protein product [Boreogadus saida]
MTVPPPPQGSTTRRPTTCKKKKVESRVGRGEPGGGNKKHNGLGKAAVGSRLLGLRAGSGPGSVNWELGIGLRGWDPVCFRGHRELGELWGWDPDCYRETWEFQGWDPDCFRGNGRLRELQGLDPDCFRGYGELGELRGWEFLQVVLQHVQVVVIGAKDFCYNNTFILGGQAKACSGEDEVEGVPLLEVLEGLEGGTPREGKAEGRPLLEGLEGGTPLEGKVEGRPLLEDLEEGHPREGVGFRNRTGLGDRSQLRGWREMLNRMALQTHHPQSDSP